jgi:type IV pilus assembly protein PilM
MRLPSPKIELGRRRRTEQLVGLDIQPGYVAAVKASVNGSVLVERAAGAALPGDAMREGEVLDEGALAETLHELFAKSRLDRRVRVGVANQRTVLRVLELPPLTDHKELAAAVRFQAEDQMPMPIQSAVLDFHPLGVVETAAGPRQRVAVVAAQRDMVERLLASVRRAGLRPEAVDLSAFALIRSLHRTQQDGEQADGAQAADGAAGEPSRVLYLNVGGLTNMAIAEGTVCRFTRVVGGGLEPIAATIAERRQIPLDEARELLASTELTGEPSEQDEVRSVLEGGVREIASEVRNSIDFHRMQDGGGEVSSVVLSGPAIALAGFTACMSSELAIAVRPQTVGFVGEAGGEVAPERLAVAAGLAIEEAPGA